MPPSLLAVSGKFRDVVIVSGSGASATMGAPLQAGNVCAEEMHEFRRYLCSDFAVEKKRKIEYV